jgi:hypothetical protein
LIRDRLPTFWKSGERFDRANVNYKEEEEEEKAWFQAVFEDIQ